MKILAIPQLAPTASPDAFDSHLVAVEVDAVLRLYQSDFIREIYTRANSRGIVFFLEAASVEEAKEKLSHLPAVERDILNIDLIPLAPFQGFLRNPVEEANSASGQA